MSVKDAIQNATAKVVTGAVTVTEPTRKRVEFQAGLRRGKAMHKYALAHMGLDDLNKQAAEEAEAQRIAEEEQARLAQAASDLAALTADQMVASIRIRLNEVAEIDPSLITSSLEVLLKDSKAADRKRKEV